MNGPAVFKLFGPPGTGKTTTLVQKFLTQFKKNEIAVVSLTKATKSAFLEKCYQYHIPIVPKYVCTMHSWCYQALKEIKNGKPEIFETDIEYVNTFLKSIQLSEIKEKDFIDAEDLLLEYSKDESMALIQALAKVRTSWDCSVPWWKHFERFVIKEGNEFGVSSIPLFKEIWKKYHEFKKENNLIDFTDMLIMALQQKINPFSIMPKRSLLVCDEFQDLYPLAVRVFQIHMDQFTDIIVAGDDDQTIFGFTGADPKYFLNDIKGKEFVLEQSYRLPYYIWSYAMKIIEKNTLRKPKAFKPTNEPGKVDTIWKEDILDLLEETVEEKIDTLLLVRTNFHLKEYISMLEEWDIPYGLALKGAVISEKAVRIIQTHEKLKNKEDILEKHLEYFCEEVAFPYIRQRCHIKRLMKDEKEQIKKALLERDPWKAPRKAILGVKDILEKDLYQISGYDRQFIEKWKYRMDRIEEWLRPSLKLMTVHSAKGLEAVRVIMDPRITQKIELSMETPEGLEAERRVWYVAVTRAKKELYIVDTNEISFPLPEV